MSLPPESHNVSPDSDSGYEPTVRERGGPSLVWLIPILTLVIGAWLVVHTLTDRGPLVTITFRTAEGIEVDKTRIKYKSLDIGLVESVRFSSDFSRVEVRARLGKDAAHFLRRDTRFWVVRPTLSARGISGLGTLLSGAYIEIEPGQGAPQTLFVGLESPPVVHADEAGKQITLLSKRLGSIDRGSPVHFQGLVAGEVLGYEMANDYRNVLIHAFVKPPFDRLVRSTTRFWSASGVDLSIGPDGMRVKTESLQALIFGGIAFDTPDPADAGSEDITGLVFTLHEDQKSIQDQAYASKVRYVLFFEESVRGLAIGAPVEFKGIKVGSVIDLRLEYDEKKGTFRIPVVVELEPERIVERGERMRKAPREAFQALVKKGMRARLQTGSLLTGQLFVALEFVPKAAPAVLDAAAAVPTLPTVPGAFVDLQAQVAEIAARLAKVRFDEIGTDLQDTLKTLNRSGASLQTALGSADSMIRQLTPEAQRALAGVQETLNSALQTLRSAEANLTDPQAPVQRSTNQALAEMQRAATALRVLADYLQRHPESLLRGKAADPVETQR